MKKVKFIISPDGTNIEVKAEGFAGNGCVETAKKFMDSLGTTTDQKLTADYYKTEGAGITVSR